MAAALSGSRLTPATPFEQTHREWDRRIIVALLARQADPNAPAIRKRLHLLIIADQSEFLELLVDAGLDLNGRDMFGRTPAESAAMFKAKKCLAVLRTAHERTSSTERTSKPPNERNR